MSARQAPRSYVTAEQLAALTPWTIAAIEKMVRRGVLKLNVHWFQPFGRRSQRIFKWEAVVDLIEGRPAAERVNVANGKGIDVQRTAEELQRLLG